MGKFQPDYVTIEDWIKERKGRSVTEPIGQIELPGRMLEMDSTNKRESERQAHLNLAFEAQIELLQSTRAKEIFRRHLLNCRTATVTVDGTTNSRNMLLEAIGRQAVVENQEKKGFMAGLFGGSK